MNNNNNSKVSKFTLFVKHVVSVLSAMAKSKSNAVRDKAGSMKARFLLFSLMKTRKMSLHGRLGMGAISHKIHALLGQHEAANDSDSDNNNNNNNNNSGGDDLAAEVCPDCCSIKAVPLLVSNCNTATASEAVSGHYQLDEGYFGNFDDDDDKYPDLRHSLFDEEWLGDPDESVIETVKNLKKDEGESFSLEDEIDHVADLFIKKFHKRIRLQKLESFKRFQDMLQRST